MLINGEKWACDACVRGHRVSNCQHSDRTLQHIAKKGRPVSQCTHCRTLRKSRSAHVKCDCGEKAHSKGACSHSKEESKDSCCCSHGGRCACALKKEPLDPVPESDSDEGSTATPPSITRPRAHTVQSEGSGLTVFTNGGHHKPAQKHNQMAHKCGLPYVVPRANSIHGPSPAGMANRSVDNLPHTNTIDALHSESHMKDSMLSAQQQQRKVKSEHNSPQLGIGSNLDQLNGQLPPLDLSNLESYSNDFNYPMNFDTFGSIAEIEAPIFSAGLSVASIDWSHYDGLNFNNDNFATSEFSQAPSFTGFEFSSVDQPALTTTSTSGEISEVEDFVFNDPSLARPPPQKYGSEFDNSDFGDEGYRLSTNSSYLGMPQSSMLATDNSLNIDDFIKGVASNSYTPMHNGLPVTTLEEQEFLRLSPTFDDPFNLPQPDEDDSLWMNDFTSSNLSLNNGKSEMADTTNVWSQ